MYFLAFNFVSILELSKPKTWTIVYLLRTTKNKLYINDKTCAEKAHHIKMGRVSKVHENCHLNLFYVQKLNFGL